MWWGLVAVAVAVGALGFLVDARWDRLPGGMSPLRVGLGAAITLLAVVMAGTLIGTSVVPPPEQRGIGVIVDDLGPLRRDRGYDRGLTLSMTVEVRTCGEPVEVRITLAPTAEFWIDNHQALADLASVRFAIPDTEPADHPVEDVVHDLEAWIESDALAPFVTGVPSERAGGRLEPIAVKAPNAAFVTVRVPEWGRSLNPLTIRFLADWTSHRSFLGGCYVSLPAVAGLPTVLSTAQLDGETASTRSELDDDNRNLFVVSSVEAGLVAYYQESYEVTRGVTALDLGDHTLQEGDSFPSPDANFGGSPAWTCRSSIPQGFDFGTLAPGDDARDVFTVLEALEGDGTISFSDQRQEAILSQRTCASFVSIEAAAAGIRRDLLLIGIGTIIALGVELLLSGIRRRRSDPASVQDRRRPTP